MLALAAIPSLLHLTLFSNPVAAVPGYRHFLVNASKSLLALDEFVITDEERIEDAAYGTRFRSLNKYMKIYVPEFTENLSAEQHLFTLDIDIYRLKRIFERNSPVLRIQSYYRGYRVRSDYQNYFKRRKVSIVKIQKIFRGWRLRRQMKRELYNVMAAQGLENLMLSNK